jgi:hypothetical protein
MQKLYIIGLTGWAGVGKDTVADLMVTHLGFRKVAFADALRGEICQGFGIEPIHLTRPETKSHPLTALSMRKAPREFLAAVVLSLSVAAPDHRWPLSDEWLDAPRSPRQIMQWWGTEYRRAQHPRYWTRIMLAKIVALGRMGFSRTVIPDVRFENEADTVHATGGILWQVTRPGLDAATTTEGAHVSATDCGVFRPAAVLANTHDIRHLQQLVLGEFLSLESGIQGVKVEVPA